MDLFRHFSDEIHYGFLEDIRVNIIERLVGGGGLLCGLYKLRILLKT